MNSFIFGIDVGGQSVKSGLFSLQGRLLQKEIIETDTTNNGDSVLLDTAHMLLCQIKEVGLSMKDCYGIGICVPGPVVKNTIVNHCVNIGWSVKNVAKELAAHLAALTSSDSSPETSFPRIIVSNDANAALLGEATAGAGKGTSFKGKPSTAVMLTLGTGVGGSILLKNNLIEGTTGSAGEVGHMPITVVDPYLYPQGKTASLESFIGAKAMERHSKALLSGETLTPKEIFDLAGNPLAGSYNTKKPGNKNDAAGYIANFTGKILGQALASIASVLDSDLFIIGGGVAGAGQALLQPARDSYKTYAFHSMKDISIVPARLGNDAGIIGCYYSCVSSSAS